MVTSNINKIDFSNNYLECPICLETINNIDPTLILECCNNKVHLLCLEVWYSNHAKQPTCILCNQFNSFSAEYIIPINSDISNNDNISFSSTTTTITIYNNKRIKVITFITIVLILFIIIPIIIILY